MEEEREERREKGGEKREEVRVVKWASALCLQCEIQKGKRQTQPVACLGARLLFAIKRGRSDGARLATRSREGAIVSLCHQLLQYPSPFL